MTPANEFKYSNFILRQWRIFTVIVVTSFILPLLEGVTLTLIFPIMQGVSGDGDTKLGFFFKYISDFFAGLSPSFRLQSVAVLIIIVAVLKSLLLFLNNFLNHKLTAIAYKNFWMLFFNQLMRLSVGYFNSRKYADFQTIGTRHIAIMAGSLNLLITVINQILNILVLLAMLLFLSWKMTLICAVLIFLSSLVLYGIMHKADSIGKIFTQADKLINGTILDAIMGKKVIHLFGSEARAAEKFESNVNHFNDSYLEFGKIRGFVQPIFEITGMVILAVIIIVLSSFKLSSEADRIGALMIFVVIFYRISQSVRTLNLQRVEFINNLNYYRDFSDFLKYEDGRYIKGGKKLFNNLYQKIELKDVVFNYGSGSAVLKLVSFDIMKGKKTGIVGPSGAGKSTLTELLLRFYDPQKGEILVDGVDLRNFDIDSWRRRIGVVSQDIFLFNDTVRANIAYGKPEATEEEIESASRKAYAHDFIKDLPCGYDSLLGERGLLLSGGQRQRIAIARAIIRNPEILIFDEATSALDTESEKIVQRALEEAGEGRTVVTIAHRLSTVFDSDKIIVIDAGCIVEQGTHRQLLGREGPYYKLVKLQNFGGDNKDCAEGLRLKT